MYVEDRERTPHAESSAARWTGQYISGMEPTTTGHYVSGLQAASIGNYVSGTHPIEVGSYVTSGGRPHA